MTPDVGMALKLNSSGLTEEKMPLPLVAQGILETRRRIKTTSKPGGKEEA
ncbi:MAG: hypothetical protein ABGZ23_04175 [Fuerstiella sp.]